jgi:hypothetical protein
MGAEAAARIEKLEPRIGNVCGTPRQMSDFHCAGGLWCGGEREVSRVQSGKSNSTKALRSLFMRVVSGE